MMRPEACPTREQLSAFLQSQLGEEDSRMIARHLEVCPECEATVESFETELDCLIDRIREPVPVNAFQQESECRNVVAAVAAFGIDPSFASGSGQSTGQDDIEELGELRDYKLLAELGKGGMGTVYKALHTKLKRVVAVKVLTAERMNDPAAVARFQREMEAVGKLDHPNIVRATDAGEVDGTHFLVMEFVQGLDVSELARRVGLLPIADACEIVRQAAVGLQHAHRHNLVHRDIKPSNLMLTPDGQIKILDLGLARLHNSQQGELTSANQMMGTVDYMAPEQTGASRDVDIRADIFSLGATLYKLLCGQAPFADKKYDTMLKKLAALVNEPIPSIQERRPEVPAELALVLGIMLAKEADDRFATPREVAERLAPLAQGADLARVVATMAEREKGDVESASESDHAARVTDEYLSSSMTETRSCDEDGQSPGTGDVSAMTEPSLDQEAHSQLLTQDSSVEDAGEVARRGSPEAPEPPTEGLQTAGRPPVAAVPRSGDRTTTTGTQGTPKFQVQPPSLPQPARWYRRPAVLVAIVALGFVAILAAAMVIRLQTGDGEIVITCSDPNVQVTVKRIDDGAANRQFTLQQGDNTYSLKTGGYQIFLSGAQADEFQITEGRIFTLSRNNRPVVKIERKPSITAVAESGTWQPGPAKDLLPGLVPRPAALPGIGRWQMESVVPRGVVKAVAYSPDGQLLACASDHVRVYDVASGKLVRFLIGHEASVFAVAWSPDGMKLASGSMDDTVRTWDATVGKPELVLKDVGGWVESVCWSPDGKQIAAVAGRLRVWNANDGSPALDITAPTRGFYSVDWSPDGNWLATAGLDTTVRLWNAKDGKPATVFEGHTGEVWRVSFSPDGKQIASGGNVDDSTVRLWDTETGKSLHVLQGHTWHVQDLAWSRDGKQLASAAGDVRLWNVHDGTPGPVMTTSYGGPISVDWSLDGKQIASGHLGRTIQFWSAEDGKLQRELGSVFGIAGDRLAVAWSLNGQQIVSGGCDRTARLWQASDGKPTAVFHGHPEHVTSVTFGPDGRKFASGGYEGTACIWDIERMNADPILKITALGRIFSTEWSSDGSWLATSDHNGFLQLWDPVTGEPGAKFEGHAGHIRGLAWSPDHTQLVFGSSDNTVKIWDVTGQTPARVLEGHTGAVDAAAWSPDSQWVASGAQDGTIRLWHAKGADAGAASDVLKTSAPVRSLAWSPDGRWLASGGMQGTKVQLWDAITRKPGRAFQNAVSGSGASVAWSPDSRRIVSGSLDRTVRVWDVVTGDTQWVAVFFDKQNSATFTAAGELLHSSEAVETQLVYVVEKPDKTQELLSPAEFRRRITEAAEPKSPTAAMKTPAPLGTWQPGPKEDVLAGLIPRPAKLTGVKRWQVERVAPRIAVTSISYSPDGKRVVCASQDNYVRVFDVASAELLRLLPVQLNDRSAPPIFSSWSPDGRWIVAGSWGNVAGLHIWDADSGKLERILTGPDRTDCPPAWSPDCKWIAVAAGGRLFVLDAESGIQHVEFPLSEYWLTEIDWNPDGTRLAASCSDKKVQLWNVAEGKAGLVIDGHTDNVNCVAWSPDGKRIASGGHYQDHSVRVWDATSGNQVLHLDHGVHVTSVVWSPDGKRIASGGAEHIRLWDADSGEAGPVNEHRNAYSVHLNWRPDGQQIVSAGGGDASFAPIQFWNAADGRLEKTIGASTPVLTLAWSPSGTEIVSGAGNDARVWDASTGQPGQILKGHKHSPHSVAWSPDGGHVAAGGSGDRNLRVWDVSTGTTVREEEVYGGQALSVSWSPDGKELAASGNGGRVFLWNESNQGSRDFSVGPWVYGLAWSPVGRQIATAGNHENAVRVWNVDDLAPALTLEENTDLAYSVTWNPNGHQLAAGHGDGTVRIWDVQGGAEKPPVIWQPGVGGLRSVAWSPDGRWIAAGPQYDTSVHLWDAQASKAGPLLHGGMTSGGAGVAWRTDGSRLGVGSADHTLRVWDINTQQELWIAVVLSEDSAAVFTPAGELLHSDAKAEKQLVYFIEAADGTLQLFTPAEFRQRIAQPTDAPGDPQNNQPGRSPSHRYP